MDTPRDTHDHIKFSLKFIFSPSRAYIVLSNSFKKHILCVARSYNRVKEADLHSYEKEVCAGAVWRSNIVCHYRLISGASAWTGLT